MGEEGTGWGEKGIRRGGGREGGGDEKGGWRRFEQSGGKKGSGEKGREGNLMHSSFANLRALCLH